MILLVVSAVEVPRIAAAQSIETESLADHVLQVSVRYGFMESPDVRPALERSRALNGARFDDLTFFIGRVTPVRTARPGMARWRKALFTFLWQASRPARLHLRLPPGQVVEVGMEVEL